MQTTLDRHGLKDYLAAGFLLILSASALATAPNTVKSLELSRLPIGLKIIHTPVRVKAVQEGDSGLRYTWTYKTTVRTLKKPVRIVEFGALVWREGRWQLKNFSGKPFTSKNFAEWYDCPGALLKPGRSYSDPHNWSGNNLLVTTTTRWYYIGRDSSGKRVKGEALITELGEVREQPTHE
jgi:hypothetical protein